MLSDQGWTFLDAGMFIGALMKGDEHHIEARPIVEAARHGEFAAFTSVDVLSEVYAALTWVGAHPPQGSDVAAHAVRLLVGASSRIQILDTNLSAGMRMLDIAATFKMTGRQIHTARNAAIALVNGVTRVYTYDIDVWQLFSAEGLRIVGPPSIVATLKKL